MTKTVSQHPEDILDNTTMLKKAWYEKSVSVAIITAIASIFSAWLLFNSNVMRSESTDIQTFITAQVKVNADLMLEIASLKLEVQTAMAREDQWRNQYIEKNLENFKLKSQLSKEGNETDFLEGFIQDMPVPSVITKMAEDGLFYVTAINDRFTSVYGITKSKAVGKTYFQIFSNNLDLAKLYQSMDEGVYSTGKSIKSVITIPRTSGRLVRSEYINFRLTFSNGEWGVVWMIIKTD